MQPLPPISAHASPPHFQIRRTRVHRFFEFGVCECTTSSTPAYVNTSAQAANQNIVELQTALAATEARENAQLQALRAPLVRNDFNLEDRAVSAFDAWAQVSQSTASRRLMSSSHSHCMNTFEH
eukprot:6198054-Pleurochrysis_carterae.AAC.4